MTTRPAHLDEWQVFTNRYGVHDPDDAVWLDKQSWCSRHKRVSENVRHPCRCPGGGLPDTTCAQAVTQEDGLCDECREWCVAVDQHDTYYRIADLPQYARTEDSA